VTTTPVEGRPSPLLAALAGILILTDGALVAIGALVWNAWRDGHLSSSEAATFTVLGVSGAVGMVVMLLAAIAFARGPRGRSAARSASGLAWLRILAVLLALAAIGIWLGGSALVGSLETFGAVFAVGEAFLAPVVTGAATRRTRDSALNPR
jgi:hypothetical protein